MTTMRDVFVATTTQWLDNDPDVALILADIGVSRFDDLGVVARHPDRVINVGIRESLAIGVAAGMAIEGFVPIIHSYAPFLIERAFEQIKLDLVHQQTAGILVSIGASFDASTEGRTHQAPGDVALLSTLPDVHIELPGHADEVEAALVRARQAGSASYVRLSSMSNPRAFGPGLHVVRTGHRATVLTLGPLLGPTLQATEGLDVQVVYTPTVRPIDSNLRHLIVPGRPIALVEPVLEGTSVAAVREHVGYDRPIYPVGVQRQELRRYGTPAQHAAAHGLDATGLRTRMQHWLDRARV